MVADRFMPKSLVLVLLVILSLIGQPNASVFAGPQPVVKDKVKDIFVPVDYEKQKKAFEGYVGQRMQISLEKRLLTLNMQSLLEPYVHRPGKQTWIGEHVGKFLHAAANVWQTTGDERIKIRMDSVAKALIATQLPDGYLGTYVESERWTNWDVWSHKYNLVGLLAYYQATGNEPALAACRKMGDLLYKTFVEEKKDIIKASTHVGMASTSVLEPMVMLYRYTGEKKYLDFCIHLTKAWEQPHGPKLISSLLEHGNVHKTANNKSYEMLSNLVGLAELYRLTGDEQYLKACTNAWKDIKTKRHYPIGTTSWGEHFKEDFVLRPDGEVIHFEKFEGPGEGCVTVTWLQLNWHLLRLSGEAAYADELERIVFNSLTGAQSPQDGSVCYFVPLEGRKRFGEVSHGIKPDVSCCSSSIPRGLSMVPTFIAGSLNGQAALLQYIPGSYTTSVKGKKGSMPATINVATQYPENGLVTLTVNPAKEGNFTVLLRVPEWCKAYSAKVGSESFTGTAGNYLAIARTWKAGDQIQIEMDMSIQTVADPNQGSDKIMLQRGPQVLAADDMLDTVTELPKDWVGNQLYILKGKVDGHQRFLRLVPFADAGQTKGHYNIVLDQLSDLQPAEKK